jgi:hypothetical protein
MKKLIILSLMMISLNVVGQNGVYKFYSGKPVGEKGANIACSYTVQIFAVIKTNLKSNGIEMKSATITAGSSYTFVFNKTVLFTTVYISASNGNICMFDFGNGSQINSVCTYSNSTGTHRIKTLGNNNFAIWKVY